MINTFKIDEEIKDGLTYKVLDLSRTLTQPLNELRNYLKNDIDKINLDAKMYPRESLLEIICKGMEERDLKIVERELGEWTRDNLLDLLYELEYRRFLDIKRNTEDIFHKIILPHVQNKELEDGNIYTVAYGDCASVIDVKTLSLLHFYYSFNGIIGGRIGIENTDVAYFNSDVTRDGKPKIITNRQPINVEKGCIQKIVNSLTKDDGTELNRQRRRMLKYHRAKLELDNFQTEGNEFKPELDSSKTALKEMAVELFMNRISPRGNKYYISIKNLDISRIINSVIWELYYFQTSRESTGVSQSVNKEFPENKLVLYSLGEAVDSIYTKKLKDAARPGETQSKKVLSENAVCIAKIDYHDEDHEKMSLSLRMVIGKSWVIKSGHTVSYSSIFEKYDVKTITATKRSDEVILTQLVYNNQKIMLPADHCWDLVHPNNPNLNIGREMAEGALIIHWDEADKEE